MLRYAPPDEVDLAAALGIEHFGPGRQYIHDKSKCAVASVLVETVWTLCVDLSFHGGGLVGVATARGEEFHGKTSRGWTRGILASGASMYVCELATDPIPGLLEHVQPLDTHDCGLSLDGVAYTLRTGTLAINATLTFSNPGIPALVGLEAGAFGLAEQIATISENQSLLAFIRNWGEYVGNGT